MQPEDVFRDAINLMNGLTKPGTSLERTEVPGLTISTIYAHDIGQYETAIIDSAAAIVVERYDREPDAFLGHKKWVEKAPGLKTVMSLGYGKIVPEFETQIKPRKS